MIGKSFLFGAACALLGACANADKAEADSIWPTLDGKAPIVIAHRGASGYLPEHTLEAYELAIDMGADVIEPDLVFTQDGVLVARHDRYLSTTTDVADHPEFADRRTSNADAGDGPREDWWVEDFTLAELKTLRARQPREGRSKEYDGLYEVPTFDEILALVSRRARELGRPVGVYPETKHPGYFASIGLDFETPLLETLEGFDAGPVYIQSFEPEILKRLNDRTSAKLVFLVEALPPDMTLAAFVKETAAYADGVGPYKDLVYARNMREGDFVEQAHEQSLFVHSWTFRVDQPNDNIAPDATGGAVDAARRELQVFFAAGVDGVFTDFPDTAVTARDEFADERN